MAANTRIVTTTCQQQNASLTTALTALDALMTTEMNLVISVPPAGYRTDSIRIVDGVRAALDPGVGGLWYCWQQFTYEKYI